MKMPKLMRARHDLRARDAANHNWKNRSSDDSAAALAACVVVATGAAFAEPAKLSGTVTDTFGSRFVVETETGKVLVDIGPKGTDKVVVKRGEKIEIEGTGKKTSCAHAG